MKWTRTLRLTVTTLTVLYILLPILVIIPASFTEANYPSFPPKGFSFQWYMKLLDRPEYTNAFINSVQFAFLAAFFSMLFGTIAGLAISKYNVPGKALIVSILTAPLTVPQLVLGASMLIFFIPMSLSGTSLGFLISHIIICIPYGIRFVLTGLSGFDYTFERAAMVLGANPFTIFWKITFPLIRPAILAGALFSFLISFDNVTMSLFMVTSQMNTLPLELFFHMQDSYDALVASVSTIVILISVLFIVILEKMHGVGRLFSGNSH